MNRLDDEPDVIALAAELGLRGRANMVEAIVEYCMARVGGWVDGEKRVSSIDDLEKLVARRLGIVFEEVWTDADLDAVIRKYVKLGDPVFAYLKHDLDGSTFGATYRRSAAAADAPDRLIAVIDCRGEKGARRFFTRWHEIAHFLVETKHTGKAVHRSTELEPLERLMDLIAARVGFYEPIFGPVFDEEMARHPRLSFGVVEAVRRNGFEDASFQSTLFACQRRLATPVVYLEVARAHKADAAREIRQGAQWLFEEAKPEALVRAVKVIPNDAAKEEGLVIHENMRVPPSSVIHGLFENEATGECSGQENLNTWDHSGGKRLADREVWVEAKKVKDRVIALVQPMS